MPEGPSVTVTLRVASIVYYSGTGVLNNCVSLGTIVSGLADFLTWAAHLLVGLYVHLDVL
jgi:hypothetical protein